MTTKRTTLLCVLDGFGLNPNSEGNAVALAKTPTISGLLKKSPNSTLTTFGEVVGLPSGQMGNSEVGHLNIGAGRVIEQWLLRIDKALRGNMLATSSVFKNFKSTLSKDSTLHLAGLLSGGGVHSSKEHLYRLIESLASEFKGKILLHLFTDGRDTPPTSGEDYIEELSLFLEKFPAVKIATVCGRFYAMDRDKRWERTEKAFKLIRDGEGTKESDPITVFKKSYASNVTDEFIEPHTINYSGAKIGDGIIFWNFREDRMRQIVRSLCIDSFDGFSRSSVVFPRDRVISFTDYDHTFHLPYLFESIEIRNGLGEVVANAGLTQLRIAETEKYPHVTYFFNGGNEIPYPREDRILIPSPRDVKTYDQKPEMSAIEVTEKLVGAIESGKFDLIVVNFANCDMVGHTGVLSAAIKAVETVDTCLGKVLSALDKMKGQAVIIADHGNAEQMIDYETGEPHTAHTTFPVPVIIYGTQSAIRVRGGGALSDIAPTILKMMGISKPAEMTGAALY